MFIRRTVLILSIMVGLFALGSCQTIYPECERHVGDIIKLEECQYEVREYRRGIDTLNWNLCLQVYNNSPGAFVWHINHNGSHRHYNPMDIRQDLVQNSCRSVLGDYWADY